MWFTGAYINKIFVKLIFKTFTLENSKKKGPNILPDPEYVAFVYCSGRLIYSQDSIFSPVQIACYIGSVEKNNNLTAKKTKRFNLIKK